jgi:hypothetical protein
MGVNSFAVFYSGALSSDDSLIKCKRAAGGLAAAVSKEGGDAISHPPRAKVSDMRDVRCVPQPVGDESRRSVSSGRASLGFHFMERSKTDGISTEGSTNVQTQLRT